MNHQLDNIKDKLAQISGIREKIIFFSILLLILYLLVFCILFWEGLYLLVILLGLLIYKINIKFKLSINKNYLKILIFLLIILYLIYTYQFNRIPYSFDGMLQYVRTILSLKNDFNYYLLEEPYKPYLIELFLALILRFFNQNIMFMMFGVFSLLSLYLTYIFYRLLKFEKNIIFLSLLILISCPFFIYYALVEIKVEPFLLTFFLLSLILFIKYFDKKSFFISLLLGIMLGVTTLMKVVIIPFSITLIGLLFIHNIRIKANIKMYVFPIITLFSFCLTLFLWIVSNGMMINWTSITILPFHKTPEVKLTRDQSLYDACLGLSKKEDSNNYYYNKSIIDFVMQPFYVSIGNVPHNYILSFLDPGIIIYISIWIFPLFFLYRNIDYKLKYIFIASQVFIFIFFVTIQTIYWYLYVIFPVVALLIPLLIKHSNYQVTKYLKVIVLSILVCQLLFSSFIIFFFLQKYDKYQFVLDYNSQINKLDRNYHIMDASINNYRLFLPFVEDYDKRVVLSNYYFSSSKKSLDDMKAELIKNNIRYVLTFENIKNTNLPTAECTKQEFDNVNDFVSKFGEKIYGIESFASIYWIPD